MFASLLICHPICNFSPPPAPCWTRQNTGADRQKGSWKSCQCTAEFLVFASKHRASLVCRRSLIFVSSPWLWCCLSKPVCPSRARQTWSRWRVHLEWRVKVFATLCDVSLKRTWPDLEASYLKTVTVSITVMYKGPCGAIEGVRWSAHSYSQTALKTRLDIQFYSNTKT